MSTNKLTKKLMGEFFDSMIRDNFPGEGLKVGSVYYRTGKGGLRHWEVQVFFQGESSQLKIDPLVWFKIRGIVFGESFAVAMEKGPRVDVTVNLDASHRPFPQVSGWIVFEENELVNLWPSLSEGKNPYD